MAKKISLLKLNRMSDQELLKVRFCELSIDLELTWLAPYLEKLHRELEKVGLVHLKPRAYFGDEWFCPEGSTLISVPFYLSHKRLADLETQFKGKIEGARPRQLMKLLRHEAGHCFSHAYKLDRTREWQRLFGLSTQPYDVENYEYRPHSKDFVRHLSGHYAQSHPDEDFAETFAVWLAPRSNWEEKYQDWPVARRKLAYVERKVEELGACIPLINSARPMSHVKQLKSTLGRYYRKRLPG